MLKTVVRTTNANRGTPKIKKQRHTIVKQPLHSRRATSQNPGFDTALIAVTASRDRRSSPAQFGTGWTGRADRKRSAQVEIAGSSVPASSIFALGRNKL